MSKTECRMLTKLSSYNHNFTFTENLISSFVRNNIFLDLIFICSGNVFVQTNKVILASVSELIKKIISASNQDVIYINLPDVDPVVLQKVFDFLYEGVTKLTLLEIVSLKDIIQLLDIRLYNTEIKNIEDVTSENNSQYVRVDKVSVHENFAVKNTSEDYVEVSNTSENVYEDTENSDLLGTICLQSEESSMQCISEIDSENLSSKKEDDDPQEGPITKSVYKRCRLPKFNLVSKRKELQSYIERCVKFSEYLENISGRSLTNFEKGTLRSAYVQNWNAHKFCERLGIPYEPVYLWFKIKERNSLKLGSNSYIKSPQPLPIIASSTVKCGQNVYEKRISLPSKGSEVQILSKPSEQKILPKEPEQKNSCQSLNNTTSGLKRGRSSCIKSPRPSSMKCGQNVYEKQILGPSKGSEQILSKTSERKILPKEPEQINSCQSLNNNTTSGFSQTQQSKLPQSASVPPPLPPQPSVSAPPVVVSQVPSNLYPTVNELLNFPSGRTLCNFLQPPPQPLQVAPLLPQLLPPPPLCQPPVIVPPVAVSPYFTSGYSTVNKSVNFLSGLTLLAAPQPQPIVMLPPIMPLTGNNSMQSNIYPCAANITNPNNFCYTLGGNAQGLMTNNVPVSTGTYLVTVSDRPAVMEQPVPYFMLGNNSNNFQQTVISQDMPVEHVVVKQEVMDSSKEVVENSLVIKKELEARIDAAHNFEIDETVGYLESQDSPDIFDTNTSSLSLTYDDGEKILKQHSDIMEVLNEKNTVSLQSKEFSAEYTQNICSKNKEKGRVDGEMTPDFKIVGKRKRSNSQKEILRGQFKEEKKICLPQIVKKIVKLSHGTKSVLRHKNITVLNKERVHCSESSGEPGEIKPNSITIVQEKKDHPKKEVSKCKFQEKRKIHRTREIRKTIRMSHDRKKSLQHKNSSACSERKVQHIKCSGEVGKLQPGCSSVVGQRRSQRQKEIKNGQLQKACKLCQPGKLSKIVQSLRKQKRSHPYKKNSVVTPDQESSCANCHENLSAVFLREGQKNEFISETEADSDIK